MNNRLLGSFGDLFRQLLGQPRTGGSRHQFPVLWTSVEESSLDFDPQVNMNMAKLLELLILCVLLSFTGLLQGTRQSQDLRCGACRALVDEMEWAIVQIDPKKTIQTGSFRINPDGSQSTKDVPFARSEGHLLELMEGVCEKMKDYGETSDPATNRKSYVRFTARDGASDDVSDVSNVSYDSRVASGLKFACETIVEQNEDEIIEFFSHETDNVKDKLCSKRTDLCDHALKIPHDEL